MTLKELMISGTFPFSGLSYIYCSSFIHKDQNGYKPVSSSRHYDMNFPVEFTKNINDIYNARGAEWLNDLPVLIARLAAEWDFKFLQPIPHLTYSFVGLADRDGTQAILKITPPGSHIAREIKWLQSIEEGVPKIFNADTSQFAFLMEHLAPGTPLKTLVKNGSDDQATKIICETIRHLQSRQHTEKDFPHLSELIADLNILTERFDAAILNKVKTLFHELTADRLHDVILHGDLHHDNILLSGSEWKAIDPHGYIGDPAAETGAMIRNPYDCFPATTSIAKIIARRLQILADELPFDAQRINAWCLCLTVLSIAWSVEGHGEVPPLDLQVVHALNQTKI
jgi:streptomycin 6-kinase